MKILSVIAGNFGSYPYVSFQPDNKGLTLISGPTGSGKSTIPDIILWTLYGITSKDGNIDDVRTWSATDATEGSVVVQTKNGDVITVFRTRACSGQPASGNDLYWVTGAGGLPPGDHRVEHRGRNSVETQAQLCQLLGADAESFLSAGYACDGSRANRFFRAPAKERRRVLDSITDLSFPLKLADSVAAAKKALKQDLKSTESQLVRAEATRDQMLQNLNRVADQAEGWDSERSLAIANETEKSLHFVTLKNSRIEALETQSGAWSANHLKEFTRISTQYTRLENQLLELAPKTRPCPTCGAVKGAEEAAKLKGEINLAKSKYEAKLAQVNPYTDRLEAAKKEENRSEERLAELKDQANPHLKYLSDIAARSEKQAEELATKQAEVAAIKEKMSALDQLNDHSFTLRGILLANSVKALEDQTNLYLSTYFDSAFRVSFDATDGDSIDVSLAKDIHSCHYNQLSKGQRKLLSLCFMTAIMEASANNSGTHFDQLFFDEVLDGMDDENKIKAFRLLENMSLSHSSIFVIDHCEAFKEMFDSKWEITSKDGVSSLSTQ